MTAPTLDALVIADSAESWRDGGFAVDDDGTCRIGPVRIELVGREAGKRILSWTLRDIDEATEAIDGLPTSRSDREPCEPAEHPNGTYEIDHIVVSSPDVDRTIAALEALGIRALRVREIDESQYGFAAKQVFFKLGDVILELIGSVEPMGDGPARFFGLAHNVGDLDATAATLGPLLPNVKDAVQPGRRIATLRHKEIDMSVATAFMSPEPSA